MPVDTFSDTVKRIIPPPMKRLSIIPWAIAGIVIVAGVVWYPWRKNPSLAPAAYHGNLPAPFAQALQAKRASVLASGNDPQAMRELAHLYQANRLFEEARSCYQIIAATNSSLTSRDHYYLADIDSNESDLAGAQRELRAALSTSPDYVPARLALADALAKSGNEGEAAKEYSSTLMLEPNNPRASIGLARIDLQRGQDDAAVARLETMMASHPESTAGAALLAQVLERRGDVERAAVMAALSRQESEPIPADPWMDALLVDCYDAQQLSLKFEEYFKAGQIKEAQPLLKRLMLLEPKSPLPKLFNGITHARSGEHAAAIRDYYDALGSGGNPEKICPLLVTSLLAIDRVSEAASLMADYSAKMPRSVPILTAYADVAVRKGDANLARSLLSKALEIAPYSYLQNLNMAKILWDLGKRDEAVKFLQPVAKIFSTDVTSRALLGEYYLGKSEGRSAIPPLEQALAHGSLTNPARQRLMEMLDAAYLQVGNTEAGQGRFAEAVNYFDRAIGLAPADLNGYAGKAGALVQLKQFRRAADSLEKLASLQPNNPNILVSLGDVLSRDGNTPQARRNWEKALHLAGPADTRLRQALEERLNGTRSTEMAK